MKAFISIIIPVFNDAEHIDNCLKHILKQDFPKELFEIIVVDNGSCDGSIEVVKNYKEVTLIMEHERKNSPYSARNRGIENSKGDIIALLDSTCYPHAAWLSNASNVLEDKSIHILGGDVRFRYDGKPTAAKYYDSLINIKIKESIENHQVSKTANLFVRKSIFEDIGLFPESIRSGGDVSWTKEASNRGYVLAFSKDSYVTKSARSFIPLLHKQWRVSLNQPRIWTKSDGKIKIKRYISINKLLPPNPIVIKKLIRTKGHPSMNKYLIHLFIIGYIVKVVMFVGNIVGVFKFRK